MSVCVPGRMKDISCATRHAHRRPKWSEALHKQYTGKDGQSVETLCSSTQETITCQSSKSCAGTCKSSYFDHHRQIDLLQKSISVWLAQLLALTQGN
eukprot:5355488-Amphidinium_carterae.1